MSSSAGNDIIPIVNIVSNVGKTDQDHKSQTAGSLLQGGKEKSSKRELAAAQFSSLYLLTWKMTSFWRNGSSSLMKVNLIIEMEDLHSFIIFELVNGTMDILVFYIL